MKYEKDKFFSLKVNTYICRELYRKMGVHRADCFLVDMKNTQGRKKDYKGWHEIFPVDLSESKIQRIIGGRGASYFTEEQAKQIGSAFNIDYEYFKKGKDKLLPVDGITTDEWKRFMSYKYQLGYVNNIRDGETLVKNVNKVMEQIVADSFKPETMENSDPLYRICWYYRNGKTYEDKDIQIRVRNRVEVLNNTKPFEWSQCTESDIEEFIKKLDETLEFLKAYKICKKTFKI
jgi:hypothetical protein